MVAEFQAVIYREQTFQENQAEAAWPFMTSPWETYSIMSTKLYWLQPHPDQIQGTPPINGRNVKESGHHNFKTTRDSFQPTKMLKQNNW